MAPRFVVSLPRATPLVLLSLAIAASISCNLLTGGADVEDGPVEIAADESPAPESFTLVVLHPAQGGLAALLASHADLAAHLERRPFVEFSAEWCPSCVILDKSLSDQRMVEAFRGTYIIRLDIDEWMDRLSGSGFHVFGVPTFFEVDGTGRPTDRVLTGEVWGADTIDNMAPTLTEFLRGSSP